MKFKSNRQRKAVMAKYNKLLKRQLFSERKINNSKYKKQQQEFIKLKKQRYEILKDATLKEKKEHPQLSYPQAQKIAEQHYIRVRP